MSALSGIRAPAAAAAADPPQPPDLDAEKAKCEGQLSDWVHCVSATTPQGKAKITELSSKLDAIKAKIDKAEKARSDRAQRAESTGKAAADSGDSASTRVDGSRSATLVHAAHDVVFDPKASTEPLPGSYVDVFV